MIIRLIESNDKHIFAPNLGGVYTIRAAERILKHLPGISVNDSRIWSSESYLGELTLSGIYLGKVELSTFTFSCQFFIGQSSLHSLFGNINFNPILICDENEPISFLFRSKHLHFNLPRTTIEKTEPYGHFLDKGYYIKEVILTKKKLEILG